LAADSSFALACETPISVTSVSYGSADGVLEAMSDEPGFVTLERVTRWRRSIAVVGAGHTGLSHVGFDTAFSPHTVIYLDVGEELKQRELPARKSALRRNATTTAIGVVVGLGIVLFGLRLRQRLWS
jgi:hypothetical protein